MKKLCECKRIEKAVEICKNNSRDENFDFYYNRVKNHVEACLEELCKISGYDGKKIEYKIVDIDLLHEKKLRLEGECFFIQFTNDGYVVVVGAGYDYGMSQNDKYLNVKIINKLGKEWSNKAILVFVTGIKSTKGNKGNKGAGEANCKNLLQCRNGVEMYLGEYLLEHNVPILNVYSHKNYSQNYWENNVKK